MKPHNLLLFAILIMIGVFPNVHAAPTLTVFPASVVTNPNTAASYIVTLSGGTANASYALTVIGLPAESVYSFSSTTIGSSGSSVLTIQTSIATPLYCPRNYPFTVTATNTLLSSDTASATGSLGVNQVGPGLVVSLSTDKSTYMVGETVTISIVTNRPAEGTLTISPPSGSPYSYQYGYTTITKTLTVTPPVGTWTITLSADDYCGGSANAVAHFDAALSTSSSTNTTTTTTTTALTSTSSSVISTLTSATSTVTSASIITEIGAATVISVLTTTTTTQSTASILTTVAQGTATSTVVVSYVQNPPLELALGFILTISFLAIATALIRRPRYGSVITCGKCGFKNPFTATSFCIKCGQPLRGGQTE